MELNRHRVLTHVDAEQDKARKTGPDQILGCAAVQNHGIWTHSLTVKARILLTRLLADKNNMGEEFCHCLLCQVEGMIILPQIDFKDLKPSH